MLNRFLVFVSLACSLFLTPQMSFALTCEEGAKEVDLPGGKFCCCTKVSETDKEEKYTCKPTDPLEQVDENGNKKKVCPKPQIRVSSKTNDKCTCELVVEK